MTYVECSARRNKVSNMELKKENIIVSENNVELTKHQNVRIYETPTTIKFTGTQPERIVKFVEKINGTVGKSIQTDVLGILQEYTTNKLISIDINKIHKGDQVVAKYPQMLYADIDQYNGGVLYSLDIFNFIKFVSVDKHNNEVTLEYDDATFYITTEQLINNFDLASKIF